MALNSKIHCVKCGEFKYVTHGANNKPNICRDCSAGEAAAKKKEYLAKLNCMSPPERLRLIEEWIYDYQPHREPIF